MDYYCCLQAGGGHIRHAPAMPGVPIYNKPEAERAWGKLVALYKAALCAK